MIHTQYKLQNKTVRKILVECCQPVTIVNMLVVTSTYLYKVIFMFQLPYMDVYFNLPISKIIHISYMCK